MNELETLLNRNSETSLNSLLDSLENWDKKSLTFKNAVETVEKMGKTINRLEWYSNHYKTKFEDRMDDFARLWLTSDQLERLPMETLREYADAVFKPYFVAEWEGETMASQLVTACCKIVYRYYNDGDRYDRVNCAGLGTYSAWIRKHCFKLKTSDNYEEKLKYLIIRTIENVSKYANEPKKGSIYTK